MQRFWNKVEKTDGCWLWTGARSTCLSRKNALVYGHMRIDGKYKKAHRVSYELHFGEIPKGKIVMHSCDTPLCVNPKHLSLGTKKMNGADMARKNRSYNQKKTHCPKGHEYSEENTYVFVSPSTNKSRRQCKICMRSWSSYNRWNREQRTSRGGVISSL